MGFAYIFHNPHGVYFVTCATVQWADVFTRSIYSDIVIESLQYCITQKGLIVHAWVIMPNHIHLIISRSGDSSLSDILRDFKKFTSSKIIEAIQSPQESRKNWLLWLFKSAGTKNSNNTTYQFWQQDNHPVELASAKFLKQKTDYLHRNPVRARLVDTPERYIYSSARDYTGEKGLLPVTIFEEAYLGK